MSKVLCSGPFVSGLVLSSPSISGLVFVSIFWLRWQSVHLWLSTTYQNYSIYLLWIPHPAPVCVKFTGTIYSTWVVQFELFLKRKDLWDHIDGTDVAQPSTFDKSQDFGSFPSWVVLDARIMSWLLGSVEPHIITNLRPNRSAQSMWTYFKKVYRQDHDARRFPLEHVIVMFQHGSLSIQDYYSAFLTLWYEYTDLVTRCSYCHSFDYLESSRD
ncbi:hypothetical protein I3760_09G046600 [Carya illinoinensis]|nr:hypothetical protein I3760_09G046600 [Carya illinoinensis]